MPVSGENVRVIAIDRPTGAGKSTTARLAASQLGFTYLDSGAFYRAVTLLALESNMACLFQELLLSASRAPVARSM